MYPISDEAADRWTHAPLVLRWAVFLAAAGVVLALCLLILRPFFGVLAWSTVLAITCYPIHHKLVRRTGRVALSAVVTSALMVLAAPPAQAFTRQGEAETQAAQRSQVIALSELPVQAQDVHRRVHEGGPFRYSKDGSVFGNRERLLPRRPRGFYREYTVPTPGERDRGARRIVCGGKEVRQPETCFYTRDHYATFQQIDPRR